MFWMPGSSFRGTAPELDQQGQQLRSELQHHVKMLAEDIGPRSLHRTENLRKAADYISNQWISQGYAVKHQVVMREPARNLSIEVKGSKTPDRILIVGAHYDTIAPDCPGANDNASGVAALLVLSDLLAVHSPKSTVRLVAFVNEEPPYFQTENMGSLVYAEYLATEKKNVIGMISLETMGYFSNEPKSQTFPLSALSLFFPDRGNFIGFVGDTSSRSFLRKSLGIFRKKANIASEGFAAPASLPGISWSDQWSFWQQGYPAFMITDTAPFRYPHYHELSDTWEKIDYESFARVVQGVLDILIEID